MASPNKPEYFTYTCPNCSSVRNAAEVAKELPPEVLLPLTRPLIGRLRRKRLAGPGRPSLARCPGCSQEMSTADLKDHRIDCVRRELKKHMGHPFQLSPKDPDPYPDFYIHHLSDDATEVEFHKGSNHDVVTIDLRKVADITAIKQGKTMTYIRVLGRVAWHPEIGGTGRWRFEPTAVGRPPLLDGQLA